MRTKIQISILEIKFGNSNPENLNQISQFYICTYNFYGQILPTFHLFIIHLALNERLRECNFQAYILD